MSMPTPHKVSALRYHKMVPTTLSSLCSTKVHLSTAPGFPGKDLIFTSSSAHWPQTSPSRRNDDVDAEGHYNAWVAGTLPTNSSMERRNFGEGFAILRFATVREFPHLHPHAPALANAQAHTHTHKHSHTNTDTDTDTDTDTETQTQHRHTHTHNLTV